MNYTDVCNLIIIMIPIILLYRLFNKLIIVLKSKFEFDKDIKSLQINYDEDIILKHLDFIIEETVNDYFIYNIRPKNIYYINNALENEIVEYVSNAVAGKVSPTLQLELSLLYAKDYIGKAVGTRIYSKVLEYILVFNVDNEGNKRKK